MSYRRRGEPGGGLRSILRAPFFPVPLQEEEQQGLVFHGCLSLRQRCLPLQPQVLFSRVDVTEDGMKALVTLSSGDMRRALNILQVQTRTATALPSCKTAEVLEGSVEEGLRSSSLLHPPLPQSTTMAFGKVTEENVYTCTGHPLKSDIANILDWMLNQDFSTAYRSILFPPLALECNPRCYKSSSLPGLPIL